MLNKIFERSVPLAHLLYFIALCVLWAAPSWPRPLWWISNLFVIAPLWVLFIPLAIFILTSLVSKNWRGLVLNTFSLAIIFFGIMGFNIPWPQLSALPAGSYLSFKVITFNMGHVKDPAAFLQMVLKEKPDVIAFQELDPGMQEELFLSLEANGWGSKIQGGMGLASRFRIRSMEVKDRRPFGGWGNIVAKYEIETPVGLVHVFDVHLETPREGVEAVIGRQTNAIKEMLRVTAIQEQESLLASTFAANIRPVVVAGDFNLTIANPIFQAYWSRYADTFSQKGFGWGYTKHTRWYGARIDHILSDDNWRTIESRVGPDVGGDHHPLISRLIFTGEVTRVPELKKEEAPVAPVTEQQVPPMPASQDHTEAVLKEWNLEAYPMISFTCKIPQGSPAAIRVRTVWGDWLCLAGTASSECPSKEVANMTVLADDGMWHEVKINVKAAVQSILPAVKFLSAFQFVDPHKDNKGERLLVDHLKIYAAE